MLLSRTNHKIRYMNNKINKAIKCVEKIDQKMAKHSMIYINLPTIQFGKFNLFLFKSKIVNPIILNSLP